MRSLSYIRSIVMSLYVTRQHKGHHNSYCAFHGAMHVKFNISAISMVVFAINWYCDVLLGFFFSFYHRQII